MNEKNSLDKMIDYCKTKGFVIEGIFTSAENIVFEERTKMNCFYCGKYNASWKCPPKIPNIDYDRMIYEFDNLAFIYLKKTIGEDFESVRRESALELHKAMLECEKWLWDNNNSTALSFIGGSCRLCKNGCAPNKCANPYQARTPVEAIGINVIKSVSNVGLNISFPTKEVMYRVGLILW